MSGRLAFGCCSHRRHMPFRKPRVPAVLGLHLALLVLLSGLLAGCAWFRSPLIKADRIDIIATPKTNSNSPVAVDS